MALPLRDDVEQAARDEVGRVRSSPWRRRRVDFVSARRAARSPASRRRRRPCGGGHDLASPSRGEHAGGEGVSPGGRLPKALAGRDGGGHDRERKRDVAALGQGQRPLGERGRAEARGEVCEALGGRPASAARLPRAGSSRAAARGALALARDASRLRRVAGAAASDPPPTPGERGARRITSSLSVTPSSSPRAGLLLAQARVLRRRFGAASVLSPVDLLPRAAALSSSSSSPSRDSAPASAFAPPRSPGCRPPAPCANGSGAVSRTSWGARGRPTSAFPPRAAWPSISRSVHAGPSRRREDAAPSVDVVSSSRTLRPLCAGGRGRETASRLHHKSTPPPGPAETPPALIGEHAEALAESPGAEARDDEVRRRADQRRHAPQDLPEGQRHQHLGGRHVALWPRSGARRASAAPTRPRCS